MQAKSDQIVNTPERLARLRRALSLTWEEFGEQLGLSRTMLHYVRSGDRALGIKAEGRLREMEKQVGLSFKETSPSHKNHSNVELNADGSLKAIQLRLVPVISWAHAGEAATYEEMPAHWQDRVPTDCPDPKAFSVIVEGDSMEPQYKAGDKVILMPSQQPRPGCLVVAKLKKDGVCFKIFNMGNNGRAIILTSYNPNYFPAEYAEKDFHWIYPVHSVVKNVWR